MHEYRHVLTPSIAYLRDSESVLLDTRGMAEFLGVPQSAVYDLEYRDRIPLPVRLGLGRTLRWNVFELLNWVQAGCPRRTDWIRMNGKSGYFRQ